MEKNSMEAFVGTYELGHVFVFSSSCCFNWLWRLLRHLCSGMLEINLTRAFLSITCIFSMKNWNNAGALHLKFRRNLYPWTVLQARPFGYCLNFLSDTDEFGIYSFWYYHDFLSQDVNVICIGWSLCNTLRQNHEMVFVGWSLIVYSLWMKLGYSPTSIDSSIRVNRSEYLPRSAQTLLCKSKDSMLVACILNQDALYVHRMRYLGGTFEATRPNWSGICCKQRPEGIVGNLDSVLLIRIPWNLCNTSLDVFFDHPVAPWKELLENLAWNCLLAYPWWRSVEFAACTWNCEPGSYQIAAEE